MPRHTLPSNRRNCRSVGTLDCSELVVFRLSDSPNSKGSSSSSAPNSPYEADLLLKTARTECKLRKMEKQCADLLVRYNSLRLQYSRVQVQRAERHLLEAERDVGRTRLTIRRCGYGSGFGTDDLDNLDGTFRVDWIQYIQLC